MPLQFSPLLAVVLVLALAPPLRAEHLRFEIGDDVVAGVPRTFQALVARVQAARFDIVWREDPQFDAYYGFGGATFGSVTIADSPGTEVTVTWSEFNDDAAAAAQTAELDSMAAFGTYVHYERAGRVVLEAYSHDGDPVRAAEVLRRIVGD